MSEKKNEQKNAGFLKYIIVGACVVLIVGVGLFLAFFQRGEKEETLKNPDSTTVARYSEKFGIDFGKYEVIECDTEKSDSFIKFNIGTTSPKRFIAQNFVNVTFYALYEDGYGYQYNSKSKTNEKNSFSSELNVLGSSVSEAYWLEYGSSKMFLYFYEQDGGYISIVSDKQF